MFTGRLLGGMWLTSWPSIRMRPSVGDLEPGQHAQQRGLAAARGPEQGEELSLLDRRG